MAADNSTSPVGLGRHYRWYVLPAVMITTFMAVLDATIVNVALPKLMAAFGVSVDRAEWIITGYLLSFGVMLPTTGWLAGRFGHKRTFMAGLVLFTVGSLLVSLAWNIDVMIAFRLLQGAGAGLLMPVGLALIMREFPPEQRGLALGFWSVASSASVALGPTVGGYLLDRYSWHIIFEINVPIGVVGFAAAAWILRELKAREPGPLDLLGLLSLSVFLGALLLALSTGNSAWNTGGWTSRFILMCFACAAAGLITFLLVEPRRRYPLIKLQLFRSANFALSNLVLFVFGLGMFGSTFLLPLYLENGLGYSPLQAGLLFVPMGVLLGLTSPIAGLLADRYDARYLLLLGLLLLAYSLYQYRGLSELSGGAEITWPLYLRGVAMGLAFPPLTSTALATIANEDVAQASGLINVMRQIGGSFGVALFGALLTRRTTSHLQIYGVSLQRYSNAFMHLVPSLTYHALRTVGGTMAVAAERAVALPALSAQQLAFIQAIDDVFLLAGLTVFASVFPVPLLRPRRRGDGALRAPLSE